MTVFALMIPGMANLSGNIAKDRERGLLSKLMSMPVKPRRDFIFAFHCWFNPLFKILLEEEVKYGYDKERYTIIANLASAIFRNRTL